MERKRKTIYLESKQADRDLKKQQQQRWIYKHTHEMYCFDVAHDGS